MSDTDDCNECDICKGRRITSLSQLEEGRKQNKAVKLKIKTLKSFKIGKTIAIVYPEFNDDWSIREIIENSCPPSWKQLFEDCSDKILTINKLLECKEWKYFPEKRNVFKIFVDCPLDRIKVVILAQDPYYNRDRKGNMNAQGIAFSIPKGRTLTASLRNIKKELEDEGFRLSHGNLESWVEQGVFLYNTALTVNEGKAHSHKFVWDSFTADVIDWIATRRPKTIFMLWGKPAQSYSTYMKKCKLLKTSHPSGWSANKGFLGCNHFIKCNEYLESVNEVPINWSV